jgi:hypothetical protein
MKQPLDGLSAVAMLAIASFAIDRIVAGVLFLFTLLKPQYDTSTLEPSKQIAAQKKLKLIYVALAAVLAVVLMLLYPNLRILSALGIQADVLLDSVLTGIVLLGGSDQLALLLKTTGMPEVKKPAPQPIQINGRLVLEEPSKAKQLAA